MTAEVLLVLILLVPTRTAPEALVDDERVGCR